MTPMNTNDADNTFSNLHAPWDTLDNVIWLATTIKMIRNIEKFKFPQKLETDRKKQLLALLLKLFSSKKALPNLKITKTEELHPLEKEFLVEHFLLLGGFQEAQAGSAVGTDETGRFIAQFNFTDHITLQKTDTTGDLEKSWAELVVAEQAIATEVNFAFSEKYGFLTADPLQCGTGCIVSSFLHLPALIHTNCLQETLAKEKCEAILATGLQGNPDEFLGDIVIVQNLHTLGVSEESIFTTIRSAVLHFVISEKEARGKIRNEKPVAIMDAVLRAVGLLKYSHQLEVPETLNALSLIKLGLEIGWLKGMSIQQINRLLFDCRRSHLQAALAQNVPLEKVVLQRAEYLRHEVSTLSESH